MAFTNYIQQITATNGTTHDLVDTSASHYVKGTQTSSTNAWTGALPDGVTAYYDGLSIDYFLPYAGTSTAATLNLGSKGAKPVYYGNGTGAVTTHYPQYSVIHLTYIINSNLNSGNGCWKADAYYNTNTTYSAGTGISLSGTQFSNSGVLSITTSAGTHSTKSSATGAVSFNVPTKTSHLTNDSGFLTSHQTAVTSLTTTAGSHSTVSSQTGAVSIAIPTKTSHLTNDSGFITASHTSTYSLPLAASGTRGGIQIGYSASGQNYAVKLSSEKAYVTVPWTDVNVTSTTVTDSTTMYLTGSTSDSTNTGTLSKHASASLYFTKDSNNAGGTTLKLGNNIASGTAGAKYGDLVLYGSTAYSVDIKTESGQPTANRTMYLPSYAGTMYLTCTSTTDAVGGATTAPVYVDNTGRIQAVTSIPYSLLTGTPTIPTNTDEKVKTIALTSGTTYYPILATGANAAANRQVDSTLGSFKYTVTAGTTSAIGKAFLEIGNNIASGTANNVKGILKIYGANSTAYLIDAQSETTASEVTLTLPDAGGTLLSSGCLNYTTSGNNRAVQRDSNGNLYVTQKDDNSNTTYALSGALSSHKFTSTLTAGGSGSGTSTSDFTLAAGTGITITDDTSNRKMTIACSVTNTDTKVTQTANTTSAWRKVLGTYNTGTTATATITSGTSNVAYYDADGPAFNTSTGELYTKGYYMYLATTDALYTAINDLGWVDSVIS